MPDAHRWKAKPPPAFFLLHPHDMRVISCEMKRGPAPRDSDWLSLEETWLDVLKTTFMGDEGQAERVMRLFHRFVKELESGSKSSKSTVVTSLENAKRLAFCSTEFHRFCWRFYRDVVLELPETEANELISEIMETMRQRARLLAGG